MIYLILSILLLLFGSFISANLLINERSLIRFLGILSVYVLASSVAYLILKYIGAL